MRIILSLAALLLAAPLSAQLTEAEPYVLGQTYTLESAILKEGARKITVRLPAEYEAEPERAFPVVYLLDGGPEQECSSRLASRSTRARPPSRPPSS